MLKKFDHFNVHYRFLTVVIVKNKTNILFGNVQTTPLAYIALETARSLAHQLSSAMMPGSLMMKSSVFPLSSCVMVIYSAKMGQVGGS